MEILVISASMLLVLAFATASYFDVYPVLPSGGTQQTAAAEARIAVQ